MLARNIVVAHFVYSIGFEADFCMLNATFIAHRLAATTGI